MSRQRRACRSDRRGAPEGRPPCIAAAGYFVVLPNLYYRSRDFRVVKRTEAALAEMFALMATLDATTTCDTQAMLDFVDAQPQADAARIGAVAYCMSGRFVVWAAVGFPERLCCIASKGAATLACLVDRVDIGRCIHGAERIAVPWYGVKSPGRLLRGPATSSARNRARLAVLRPPCSRG